VSPRLCHGIACVDKLLARRSRDAGVVRAVSMEIPSDPLDRFRRFRRADSQDFNSHAHHFCAREKCPQPIKGSGPLSADRGDGWLAQSTRCRLSSIKLRFFCAAAPQSMNATRWGTEDICVIKASVKASHPLP